MIKNMTLHEKHFYITIERVKKNRKKSAQFGLVLKLEALKLPRPSRELGQY